MTRLSELWTSLHGDHTGEVSQVLSLVGNNPDAPQWAQPRSAILVWLQDLETLARGLGYEVPSPSASTFSTTSGSQAPIEQWSNAWERIAHGSNGNLPPEDLFQPRGGNDASQVASWSQLATTARAARARQGVVTYLLRRASVPAFAADSPLESLDVVHRRWWADRLASGRPFAVGDYPPSPASAIDPSAPVSGPRSAPVHVEIGPGSETHGTTPHGTTPHGTTPHGTTPTHPSAPTPTPSGAQDEDGGSLLGKVVGAAIAAAVAYRLGKKKGRR